MCSKYVGFMFHKSEHFRMRSVSNGWLLSLSLLCFFCFFFILVLCVSCTHNTYLCNAIQLCAKKFFWLCCCCKILTKQSYIFLGLFFLVLFFHFTLCKTYRTRNVRQWPYCSVGISFFLFIQHACVILGELFFTLYTYTCVCLVNERVKGVFDANTTC